MKLVRIEMEWEDGSIGRLSGDAAEEWHERQSGAATLAWAHGARYSDDDLPQWETVREKTHDVPDGLDPVTRKVHENSKAFYAMLPGLRKTLAGRHVVIQDQQVVKDFATVGEAYEYALQRFGHDGGFAIGEVEVERDYHLDVMPRPLSSAELRALWKEAGGE